jgi:malonyl-CoA decarboxylase
MKTSSSFSEFVAAIGERGKTILRLTGSGKTRPGAQGVIDLCHRLLSAKGEASGIALAHEVLTRYGYLTEKQRLAFFQALYTDFAAESHGAERAARAYLAQPTADNLLALARAVEPSRQELIRQLNQAPQATLSLVRMRADLLQLIPEHPELRFADQDFVHLLGSWFNRGFLELRAIDWRTSAALLEKIIEYEAVHGMSGWDDLRRRLDPADRSVYGFFHPCLGDEPLIFVEVALTREMPASIETILATDRDDLDPQLATTAVFYSISNCQPGLRGIPLGNFLIKQVVEDLRRRFSTLRDFVTLSPIPTFADWLKKTQFVLEEGCDAEQLAPAERSIMVATAWFLLNAKTGSGRPVDPVARFHLGNGARLARLNWSADTSGEGLRGSLGIMANYRYKLDEIESNHERYADGGVINAAAAVSRLARGYEPESGDPVSKSSENQLRRQRCKTQNEAT